MALCFIGDPGFERFVIINARGGNFTWWHGLAGSRFRRTANKTGWASYLPVPPRGGATPPGHVLTASVCDLKRSHVV